MSFVLLSLKMSALSRFSWEMEPTSFVQSIYTCSSYLQERWKVHLLREWNFKRRVFPLNSWRLVLIRLLQLKLAKTNWVTIGHEKEILHSKSAHSVYGVSDRQKGLQFYFKTSFYKITTIASQNKQYPLTPIGDLFTFDRAISCRLTA